MKKLKKRQKNTPIPWLKQVELLYSEILAKPDHGEAYINLTALLEQHQRYEEALDLYSQGLRKLPSHGLLQMNYGLLLYKLGEVESGRILIDVAKDLLTSPDSEEVKALRSLKQLGQTLFKSSRFKQACKTYAEIVRLDPDNYHSQYILASLLFRFKNYAQARIHYEQVLELTTFHEEPVMVSKSYLDLANIVSREQASPDYLAHYNLSLRYNPQLTPSLYHFFSLMQSSATPTDIFERYALFLEHNTKGKYYPLIYTQLARLQYESGDLEAAEKSLAQAVQEDPNCIMAQYYLGFLKAEQGNKEAVCGAFQRIFETHIQAALVRSAERSDFSKIVSILHEARAAHSNALGLNGALGVVGLQAGDYTLAAQCFEKALSLCNKDSDILRLKIFLAAALQAQAEHAQALELLIQLKADLNFTEQTVLSSIVYQNLAKLLAKQEMEPEFEDLYQRAFEYNPQLSPEFFHFTRLMEDAENYKTVQQRYQSYLEATPQEPKRALVLCHLGMALRQQRKLDEALEIFEEAHRLDESCVLVYFQLAILQVEMESYKNLFFWIKKAQKYYPEAALIGFKQFYQLSWVQNTPELQDLFYTYRDKNQQALFDLSMETNTLQLNGEYRKVVIKCNQFLKLHPRQIEIIALKARALSLERRYQEAYDVIYPVIETGFLHGDLAEVFAMICLHTKRFDAYQDYIGRVLACSDLHFSARRKINYLLGQINDKAKNADQAFKYFKQGAALKSQSWSSEKHEGLMTVLRNVFTRETMLNIPRGNHSARPVFVVGMPRSGTTLTEQILCSHPDVFGAGEIGKLQELFLKLLNEADAKNWRSHLTYQNFVESQSARLEHVLKHITPQRLAVLAEEYLSYMSDLADRKGYAYIVNKMPGNFQHLGLIQVLFPNAIIFHCQRHPLDTCLSCFGIDFKELRFTNDLEHLGRYYRQYQMMIQHWEQELDIPILGVRYEDTIADQEAMSRRLIAHLNLDWDERCLSFFKTDRHVKTASYEQVRKPIYTTSVARYKPYETHLEPLKEWIDLSEWE